MGSQSLFVGILSSFVKIKFIDIRPLDVSLDNFENISGNILNLPIENNSVSSLSCLHVAEHIGLGRYGDALDPQGTQKACKELERILCEGGHLFFSVPIGKERTYFNAHRVYRPETILKFFPNLRLVSFSAVDDKGRLIDNAQIENFVNAKYSCGLFEFTK